MDEKERRPLPSWNDWLHVVLNGLFVVGGLLILPAQHDVGIVTLAFFGTGLVVSIWRVADTLRLRRQTFEEVGVVGGVPIRASSRHILLIALWMLVLGIILFVFGKDYPLIFRAIAVFIALAGGGVAAYLLLGGARESYLQFDSDALTVSEKGWLARIPWNSISEAAETDVYGNAAVLLWAADEDIDIEPASRREQTLRTIARTRALYTEAAFALHALRYDIDAPVLLAAIEHYRGDESARAELGKRALAP